MFKFMGFYLRTELPEDKNRLQGVERGNGLVGSPLTLRDGVCVAIPTVNPWVSSVLTHYNPIVIKLIYKSPIINLF